MNSFTVSSTASFGNPGANVVLRGFGDFSGDGKADLLLFDTSRNVVSFWQSNGAQQPTTVSLAQVGAGWVPVVAQNLDGAGNAEIIWRQTSTGTIGAWQVSGSSVSVYISSIPVGLNWQRQPQGFIP
jgi:FG-GAP-like repeat